MDPAVSAKLRALAMVGMLMVVVGHSPSYRDPQAPSDRSFGYTVGEFLLTDALPRIVVMMFFTISGYLLFWGHDGSAATWRRKLGARTRSLAVPYLVWSALGLAAYFALQTLPWTRPWFENSARLVVGRSAGELLQTWLVDPIAYQLWFLRDLYLLVVIGPLLGVALSRLGWLVPIALFVPYWFDVHVPSNLPDVRLMTSDCYFFFALGGACAVRRWQLRIAPWLGWLLVLATLALAVGRALDLANGHRDRSAPSFLPWWKSVHLVGVPALWFAYDRWLRWLERPFWLAIGSLSFFVFVAHEPLMTTIRKPLTKVLGTGDLRHATQCVLSLVLTLAVVLAAGALLRRAAPRVFAFLCGGRS